jgi:hypothetical protein
VSVQGLKLLVCNGCTRKTDPYRSITILMKYAEQAGWTTLNGEGLRPMHFCPNCTKERNSRGEPGRSSV